ncbi:MAG TPA: type II secretion system F family protein [Longimicrobiales bacterium]|nr:type II secretion system F family protein [Longimicrobiales bacterium]
MLLVAISSAITVALLIVLVANSVPVRARGMRARMAELELDGLFSTDAVSRRARQRSQLQDLLRYLGSRMQDRSKDWSRTRRRLISAGYRESSALPIFLGIRVGATVVLATYGLLFARAVDMTGGLVITTGLLGAAAGWVVPNFLLSARVSRRKNELQKGLPDMLDLLVICVEAGLGLNQAMVRVAQELRHSSRLMTQELSLTNMAIRAGTPRDQALMDLAERTDVPDIRSLSTMLIQTERFGTSIAHSLRVHAESMRTKRRQRAEEAAAKTTIKMIFPLALCIFPALFVVVLGPAVISIMQTFASMG